MLRGIMLVLASISTLMAIVTWLAYKEKQEEVFAHYLEAIGLILFAILCILVAILFKSAF